jgi:hypothetical protein
MVQRAVDESRCGCVYFSAHLMYADRTNWMSVTPRTRLHAEVDHDLDEELIEELGAAVVGSGTPGHRHLHLELTESVTVAEYKVLIEALRGHLGGDSKIRDSDMLRIPGSLNFKTTPPRLVRWTRRADTAWEPEKLAAHLGVVLHTPPPVPGSAGVPVSVGSTAAPTIPTTPAPAPLPEGVQHAIDTPPLKEDGTPDRNRWQFAVVKACMSDGLDAGQTASVVLSVPELAQRLADRGDGHRDLLDCWEKVGKSVRELEARAARERADLEVLLPDRDDGVDRIEVGTDEVHPADPIDEEP